MMAENVIPVLRKYASKEGDDSVYPMYFGVSCAFAALHFLSNAEGRIDNGGLWPVIVDRMLQGSAQLLGMIIWKAQGGESMGGRSEVLKKLKKAELVAAELKKQRSEDAKANEKVVGIFAAREQSWIAERKKLRQQIQALLCHSRALEKKREETISKLNARVEERENLLQSKDEALQEEKSKRELLQEKLQTAEAAVEELRETARKEAQEHSSELWRHKTAFIELVSHQRQLEAEMGRALRQIEVMKQELDAASEQKEESAGMVQDLSIEIAKLQKDGEQKDKILSAMLRKSKLDTAEKQMLLKELKISKARRKQAELETERWKLRFESRHDRRWKGDLANRGSSISEILLETKALNLVEPEGSQNRKGQLQLCFGGNSRTYFQNHLKSEDTNEIVHVMPRVMNTSTNNSLNQSPPDGNEEIDAQHLEEWVRTETEKYISILDQRHSAEIDAFVEQMRLKDEKLDALRWQLLSLELESKRLQSHIEELNENFSELKEEYMKLEDLLLDKEKEMKSLKENIGLHAEKYSRRNSIDIIIPAPGGPEAVWSEVKVIKRKKQKELEKRAVLIDATPLSDKSEESNVVEISGEYIDDVERREIPIDEQPQIIDFADHALEEEIVEEREVGMDPGHIPVEFKGNNYSVEVEVADKLSTAANCLVRKDILWKTDRHALGVSYKIKRLKQQLLMVEKLSAVHSWKKTAKRNVINAPESYEKQKTDDNGPQMKGFLLLMSLLNKQVKRYESLEEKTDDICKRMRENEGQGRSRESEPGRAKDKTSKLKQFLEETFQLQRYVVATGQKLMEIQSRISCSLGNTDGLHESIGFNVQQFSENVGILFRETQRGLEVRIARIIGDLEGILTSEGILHLTS